MDESLDAELAAIRRRTELAEYNYVVDNDGYGWKDDSQRDVPRLLEIIDRLRAELAAWEQDHLDRHGWKEHRVPVDGSIYK